MARAIAAVVALVSLPAVAAKLVTIDNTRPRLTSTGSILDGHDGRIQKFSPDGPYYAHLVEYGDCIEPAGVGCNQTPDKCGFQLTHNISVWTSDDISSGSWEFKGHAIEIADRPEGTVFRPDVVYSPASQQYVMWWNWVTKEGVYQGFATSVSSTPEGPFKLVQEVIPLTHANATYHAGDYHLFMDDDDAHTGYVIYSAEFYMWIEQLTPDLLNSTGNVTGPVGGQYFVEAPVMFKWKGLYYALFDHCCCYCFQGSGVMVFTAPHPLGPWTQQVTAASNLACEAPVQARGDVSLPRAVDTPYEGAWTRAQAASGSVSSRLGEIIGMPASPAVATPAAADSTITVVDASFGGNCNAGTAGDVTQLAAAYCNGKPDCGYQVCICGDNTCEVGAPPCVPDPALGCAKTFHATWTCSGDSPVVNYTASVPAEADNALVPLSCSGAKRPYVVPTDGQGCLYNGAKQVSLTRSQQNGVAVIDTQGPDGAVLIWIGDRWQQSPDGQKGHDPQFMAPLRFAADGLTILPLEWIDNFTIDVV